MSASAGTGISATEVVKVLPPEVARYFMLRFPPSKRLYFDEQNIDQLIDEFAGLAAAEPDSPLVQISLNKLERVVSNVPFSHLVAAYQSALKDIDKTIDIIKRASPQPVDEAVVKKELKYIDGWLKNWAPESIKFELSKAVKKSDFSEPEMQFLSKLADA